MQRRQSGSQFAIEPVTSKGPMTVVMQASKQFPTAASVAATATFVATAAADNDRIHSHDHDIVSTHRPNDQVP